MISEQDGTLMYNRKVERLVDELRVAIKKHCEKTGESYNLAIINPELLNADGTPLATHDDGAIAAAFWRRVAPAPTGELRRCPFCGGRTHGYESEKGRFTRSCTTCGARGPIGDSIESSLMNWQVRVPPPAPRATSVLPNIHAISADVGAKLDALAVALAELHKATGEDNRLIYRDSNVALDMFNGVATPSPYGPVPPQRLEVTGPFRGDMQLRSVATFDEIPGRVVKSVHVGSPNDRIAITILFADNSFATLTTASTPIDTVSGEGGELYMKLNPITEPRDLLDAGLIDDARYEAMLKERETAAKMKQFYDLKAELGL